MRKTTLFFLVMFVFCSLSSFGQVWSEDFESGIPASWQRFTLLNGAPGTVPAWENATGTACEGTTSAFVSNALIGAGNTSAAWLVTPQVTIPANPELSFKAVQASPSQNGSIYQLWISTTSQTDVSTFTMVRSWTENEMNPGNQLACYTQTVSLTAYTGQSVYLAFVKVDTQYANTRVGDRLSLDDVQLNSLCFPPTAASAQNVGSDNADIVVVGTTPGSWEICLIPGVNSANTGVATHSGTSPIHITGLSSASPYTYYVRSNCGTNSYSSWIGPYNFTTSQASTTMPFSDNFDSGAVGWTFTTGTQINQWNVGTATSSSGSRSMYISDNNGVTNSYTITQTSVVHAYRDIQIPATTTNLGISFDWKGLGEVNDYFYVWAVPVSYVPVYGTNITAVANNRILIGSAFYNSASYQNFSYMLDATPFRGQTMRLVFEWRNNSFTGTQPPASVDNVVVNEVTCVVPNTITYAGITSNTATINWVEAGTATAWDVLLLPMGSAFPNANATGYATVTGTPTYNATNLVASTGYDVYVRSVCSSSNKSFWVRATPRLTTACGIIVPPFTETFNSTSPSEACWTVVDANADNLTWNLNTTYFMYEGDQAASITKYWNSTSNNDWLISPQIQLNGNQRLKFRYRVVSASYPTDLEVLLSTSGAAPANFTNVLMPQQTITNADYAQKIVYLNNYTGVVNIALHVPNVATNSWTLFIDEVIVEDIPPCAAPTALTASNLNNTSATLSWTAGFQETAWEVKVQPINSGVPTTDGVVVQNTPTYNVQNLNPATQYEYYVRARCSDSNKSEWVGPFVFNTIVCPVENRCNYTVTVTATTGNGTFSRLNFYQNGILVGTVSALSGLVNTGTVAMCPDIPFTVNWDYASWSTYTASVLIQDSYAETVYQYIKDVTPVVLPITVPVYSGVGNCTPVACPKPQNVISAGYTTTSVTVDWAELGSATSWEVYAVPTGQAGPGANSVGIVVTQHPYTIENLTPGMRYSIYVRSVCSETSKSTWTLEKVLSTNITNDNCDTAYVLQVSSTGYCESPYHATLNMATASPQGNLCGIASYANDDVWFQFTATSTSHIMYINNRAGSNTNLNLSKVVYSGDCNNLQQVLCTQGATVAYNTTYFIYGTGANNNDVLLNNLTVGTTYKIRIFSNYATANDVRFDICIGTPSRALTIDETTYTPEQLITDVLIDENCAQATNINYSTGTNFGSTINGIAYFNRNGADFPFERGIILSTGKATNASGPKTTIQSATYAQTVSPYNTLWLGDQDLYNYIVSTGTAQGLNNFYNASSIEFDFMAYGNEMSFDFLFASEDYGLFQCNWGDAFAFFLTDDHGNTTNLAVVPDTTSPVSVTTIRDSRYNYDTNTCASSNPEYFDKLFDGYKGYSRYAASDNFLGNTKPMTVRSAVVPGEHYHIKMVIAEKNDGNYDSAIFLDGDSFNVGRINLGDDLLASTNNALCYGTNHVLNTGLSSDYFTFVWKNGSDVIDGATGSTYMVTAPGTYSVTATVITSGCTTTDDIIIEYNENISAIVNAPADLTVCSASAQGEFNLGQNTTAILNDVATAADYEVSYYESLADAQTGADETAITNTTAYQAVNNHVVYVRVENTSTGCYVTYTFNTIVTPNTIAETGFTYTAGSCVLGTINPAPVKNTSFTEGGTYSVTDSNITVDAATGVVDLSQSLPGTYVVRYTVATANCLTGGYTEANITINAATPASVTFSYNTACTLDSSSAPVLPAGFTANGTFSSTTLTVNAITGVVDLTGVTAGTYQVTYTVTADAVNCIAAGSYTADIIVNTPTVVSASFSYDPACGLNATAAPILPTGFTNGGSFSSTDVTVDATTGVVDLTNIATGTYLVTYTIAPDVTNCIAGDSFTATLTVTAPTAVSANFSYDPACGLNATAAPILPAGFTTGGTFASADLTVDATIGVVNLTSVATGTYQVTYTITPDTTNCVAGDSFTATLSVTAPAVVSANFSYDPACALNTTTAPVLPTGFTTGGTFSSTVLTVNAATGVVDLTGVASGTYPVTYTIVADATNCISGDSYTTNIVVTTPSSVSTSFSYDPVCAINTTAAPILPTGFTTGGTFSSTALTVDATTGVVDLTGVASGTYAVTYTLVADAVNCVAGDSYTANIVVTAPGTVSPSFSYATVCTLVTSAAPVLPTGFTTGGTFSSTTLTVNATTGMVDLTGIAAGTYQVVYTITADAANCIAGDSYTASIVVTQSASAVTSFTYEVEYCNDPAIVSPDLDANFTTGGVFTVNNSGLSINAASGEIDLSESVPGIYEITYTYASQGCVAGGSSSFTLELKNELVTEVTSDCKGSEFWLQAYPVNGSYNADEVSYIWADANGTEIGIDSASFNVSDYRKNNSGVSFPAVISVTVVSGRCNVTKEFEVQSMLCDVQRGISPNGDDANEALDLRGMNVVRVSIFNRYGKEVYKFNGTYTNEWHGQTNNNADLPTGTYFYSIVTKDGVNKTGWIYINR